MTVWAYNYMFKIEVWQTCLIHNHIFLQCFWITYVFWNPNFLSSEVEVHKNYRIKILIGLGISHVAFNGCSASLRSPILFGLGLLWVNMVPIPLSGWIKGLKALTRTFGKMFWKSSLILFLGFVVWWGMGGRRTKRRSLTDRETMDVMTLLSILKNLPFCIGSRDVRVLYPSPLDGFSCKSLSVTD